MTFDDPADVTRVIRQLWTRRGDRLGRPIDVPDCPFDRGELHSFAETGRRVGYLPRELATQRGRAQLGEIFPLMRCYSLLPDNLVVNDEDAWGWFDYEAAVDADRLDLDEGAAVAALLDQGRVLLSLNQYIVASQDSHELTGAYLDERRSWIRVGSRIDGNMVAARFDGAEMADGLGDEEAIDGTLLVAYDVQASDRAKVLGVRSTARSSQRRVAAPEPAAERAIDVVAPPDDLEAEWRRQVQRHVDRGFHRSLGLDIDTYVASLPRPTAQPPEYAGRFDVPLLVDGRVPWSDAAPLAGINLSALSRRHGYQPIDPSASRPTRAYWAWFSGWGQRFPDPIAPADARSALRDDEVAGDVTEMVAMHLAHPDLVERGRWLEAIGSVMPNAVIDNLSSPFDAMRVAGLMWWRARPEIGANLHPTEYTMFRPVVRGATITT
jgi:hypothetical protein